MDWFKGGFNFAKDDGRVPTGNFDADGNGYWVITAGAANTKGSYRQITAACPVQAAGIILTVNPISSNTTPYLADIAFGGAGSELDIIKNMPFQAMRTGTQVDIHIFIPLKVPKGTRVSMRCQSTTASAVLQVSMVFVAETFASLQPPSFYTSYGVDTTTSSGTSVATSQTPAAVQITAATTAHCRFCFLYLLNAGSDDYEMNWLFGTTPVLTNIRNSGQGFAQEYIPLIIPKGTQVQVKIQSINSTTVKAMFIGGS